MIKIAKMSLLLKLEQGIFNVVLQWKNSGRFYRISEKVKEIL